jgi:hypothetical protein
MSAIPVSGLYINSLINLGLVPSHLKEDTELQIVLLLNYGGSRLYNSRSGAYTELDHWDFALNPVPA